jgi:hypothetical protein
MLSCHEIGTGSQYAFFEPIVTGTYILILLQNHTGNFIYYFDTGTHMYVMIQYSNNANSYNADTNSMTSYEFFYVTNTVTVY